MAEPELARISHIALETDDLSASLEFFHDAVGLEEVERQDGTVYLRGIDEFSHHSLSLTPADEPGIDHIGWQTEEPEHLDAYADLLADEGVDVTWVDEGAEAGQGRAIRFETPTGQRFEFHDTMTMPEPPEEKRSKLRNKPYDRTKTNPIAPQRIDHVQIWDRDANELVEWLKDVVGLQVQESYDREDGSRWGTFLSACGVKIDLAIVEDEGDNPPAVHHTAYKVTTADDLYDAHDAMNELDIPTDGIGQHSISRGKFLYVRDPATGHRIEFNAGGYFTFEANWEPVRWKETDLDDRQWIGAIESKERVFY